jgi:hypothetical protein
MTSATLQHICDELDLQHLGEQILSHMGDPLQVTSKLLEEVFELGAKSARDQAARTLPDDLRESVLDAVGEALGGALDCTRVWSAWQMGTMSAQDFVTIADDAARVGEIVDAAVTELLGGGLKSVSDTAIDEVFDRIEAHGRPLSELEQDPTYFRRAAHRILALAAPTAYQTRLHNIRLATSLRAVLTWAESVPQASEPAPELKAAADVLNESLAEASQAMFEEHWTEYTLPLLDGARYWKERYEALLAASRPGGDTPVFWKEHLKGGLDELDNLLTCAVGSSAELVPHASVKAITKWLRVAAFTAGEKPGEAVTVESDDDFNYFRRCIGASYTSAHFGKHEAIHPVRVKEVLQEVEGTRAADVISSMVFDIEIRSQRERRMGEALFQKARAERV